MIKLFSILGFPLFLIAYILRLFWFQSQLGWKMATMDIAEEQGLLKTPMEKDDDRKMRNM